MSMAEPGPLKRGESNLTNKSFELIEAWQNAKRYRERIELQLQTARRDEAQRVIELGKFMTPENANAEERFQIWVGDALLQIEVTNSGRGNFSVNWRDGKEPRLR